MKNRAERRAYERKIKNDKRASKCPICKHTSLFFTKAVLKPEVEKKEEYDKEDFNTEIVCENCGAVVYSGEEVSKLLPPGVYLPLPLDIVEYALRHPELEEAIEDAKSDLVNSESMGET